MPGTIRDVFVNARVSRVLSYDNVGKRLSPGMSDALCQIASGTGLAQRKLFTDAEEAIINSGSRLTMLSSIDNVGGKADFASRQLLIKMEQIKEYQQQSQIVRAFQRDRPLILGALLDCVSRGLGRLSQVRVSSVRMSDFAHWATACELAPGAFMLAFEASAIEVLADVVEQDGVVIAIEAFIRRRGEWGPGTVTQLMTELEAVPVEQRPAKWRDWPRDPGAFGKRLTAAMSALRKIGIECTRARATEQDRNRLVTLRRVSPAEHTGPAEPGEPAEPRGAVEQPAREGNGALVA